MRDNKANVFIAFIIIFTLFGFFPGTRIKYFSPIETSKFLESLDYFIKNFFHLWKIKLVASIGTIFISYLIKEKKLKKHNKRKR
ncbi:hypothetical protein [Tissierella praeacuta]|uniref:hypothetical protein n=1 Tax=Tissierella praeacuta TaxID=43131 RepID=UPI001C0FC11F|nr:hypothetical protein [Tissierella praeacuta]MBU5257149.1 hypothetical protein [Tissierella praeacuta]